MSSRVPVKADPNLCARTRAPGPAAEESMAQILVDGIVSDVQRGSETTGGGGSYRGTGSMQVSTTQLTIMRIGKQAAELKSKSMFHVKDGDRLIAAGRDKNGILKIRAARNISAGTN